MGNFPINQAGMLDAIAEATANHVPIIVVTQCRKGTVASEYEAGNLLVQKGAILAADMSIEAAAGKLSYLLGKKYPYDQIHKLIQTDMWGEIVTTSDDTEKLLLKQKPIWFADDIEVD